jgi:acyl dehydratase
MNQLTYEELRDGSGLDLGSSRWVEVDQARIDRFAEVSEDHQWIHVDPQRAATGAFGTTIAHGYLTITLVGTLLGELLRVDPSLVMVNYGLDSLGGLNR